MLLFYRCDYSIPPLLYSIFIVTLMNVNLAKLTSIPVVIIILLAWFLSAAQSHPDDEFCDQTGADALLCAELAALDRTDGSLPTIELDRPPLDTFTLYVRAGAEHILPLGLDHVAFVLALVLSASLLRPLLIQISIFTLAHSVTLVLGAMNVVSLNGLWVELAIALSIAFVAIENLFIKYREHWRYLIIFGFGLLHGLGFAGALGELGIPQAHFISALAGFNVGVEIAQISFGLVMFVLLHKLVKQQNFKRWLLIVGNCLVALAGVYWLIERLIQ